MVLWGLIMESGNSAATKIDAENVDAVYLPCLSITTTGIVLREIYCQERITQDRLRRKGASNFHRDFFFLWECVYSPIFFHGALCHKIGLEKICETLAHQNLTC